MQLGIVIHHLCDFCCNSHITGSIGNVSYHLKYERDLQKYLLENFHTLKTQIHNKSNNINSSLHNLTSIKASIDKTLLNYLKGDASLHWDVKHCVEISSFVCSVIFNSSSILAPSKDKLQLSN